MVEPIPARCRMACRVCGTKQLVTLGLAPADQLLLVKSARIYNRSVWCHGCCKTTQHTMIDLPEEIPT